jgi:chromosomal replication initiation ATPase DnaA
MESTFSSRPKASPLALKFAQMERERHTSELRERIKKIRSDNPSHYEPEEIGETDGDGSLEMRDIKRAVCEHFFIPHDAFHQKKRPMGMMAARQIAMFLADKHCKLSRAQIARSVGLSDHTTVIHGIRRVEEKQREYPYREHLQIIRAHLRVLT